MRLADFEVRLEAVRIRMWFGLLRPGISGEVSLSSSCSVPGCTKCESGIT